MSDMFSISFPKGKFRFIVWKITGLIVMSILSEPGASQNRKIDSLQILLSKKNNPEYSYVLPELAFEYVLIEDYAQAIEYAEAALQIARKHGDSLLLVRSIRIKASAFRRSGKTDSAKLLYNQALPIAKRNNYDSETEVILNSVGSLYAYEALYDRALSHFFESLTLRYKNGSKADISIVLNNIGWIYYKLSDYDKALSFYVRSLQLKKELKEQYDLDLLLINISFCYIGMDNFSAARSYIRQGLAHCGELCTDYILLNSSFSLGLLSLKQNKFSEAELYFLKSHALAKKSDNTRYQLDNIIALSKVYFQNNQLALAEKYLQESLALIAKDAHYNLELIGVYSQFFTLYNKSKNFEKAAYYQSKYIALKDSIFSYELTNNLMMLEAEHLEKENRAKIDFQNRILELNNEIIFRQRIANIFVGIVAVLGVTLAIVLAKNNRQKRKANDLLDKKVKERTQELELNRNYLERAMEARDAAIHRSSADIKSSIATIKGLCLLGIKDIEDPNASQYFIKVNSVSDVIFQGLNKLLYSDHIGTH